jgi:hypothetical protein
MRLDQRRLTVWAICIGVPLLFLLMPPTRPIMLATLGVFAHSILWLFDCAFGGEAFGIPPVVTWSLVGAFIGACLGYWSVAPAIGRRRMRRIAGAIPLTLIACLLAGDILYSVATAQPLPKLRPPIMDLYEHVQQPTATSAGVQDPTNVKPPGLYSTPTEEELSTAPEGGGGSPTDKEVQMAPPVLPVGGTSGGSGNTEIGTGTADSASGTLIPNTTDGSGSSRTGGTKAGDPATGSNDPYENTALHGLLHGGRQ